MDQSKLIDALAERGMDELLLHLAETGEFDDPATPRMIEVGQRTIALRDPALSSAERREAFDAARLALRGLIDDPEMAELARDEVEALEAARPALEENMRLALIP
ncbi:MAG: hypothetical protein AAGL98_05830, partial [Planctomycetota bacterium]